MQLAGGCSRGRVLVRMKHENVAIDQYFRAHKNQRKATYKTFNQTNGTTN